jgi:hypothetical protein
VTPIIQKQNFSSVLLTATGLRRGYQSADGSCTDMGLQEVKEERCEACKKARDGKVEEERVEGGMGNGGSEVYVGC